MKVKYVYADKQIALIRNVGSQSLVNFKKVNQNRWFKSKASCEASCGHYQFVCIKVWVKPILMEFTGEE